MKIFFILFLVVALIASNVAWRNGTHPFQDHTITSNSALY